MSFETCSHYDKTRLVTDKSAERLTQAAKPSLRATVWALAEMTRQ
jgi:hypothetical protein